MTGDKDIHQIRAELDEVVRQMSEHAVERLDTLADQQIKLGKFMTRVAEEVVSISERLSALENKR